MSQPIDIAVAGALGRMGQAVATVVSGRQDVRLAARFDRPGTVEDGLVEADAALAIAQVVIDFTSPAATVAFAELAAQARAVHVIGTTGLEPDDLAKVKAAARHAPIIRAGNMSLGVNLLVGLTRKVAAALGEDWDIEVVEAHHNRKVDAPSGTALMLGEAAAEGRGHSLDELRTPAREGITGARAAGTIGFSAIRGGDIVGEHDVIFATAGERVILRHVATDRTIFARGALRAALWGQDKGPGEYDMSDVLGL